MKLIYRLGAASVAVLAFAASASAQSYPAYPPPAYPAQNYPPQNYPPQSYPAQPYPNQQQPYRPQAYPQGGGYPPQAAAQSASNPLCLRLEAQLASIDSSSFNSGRAEQIKRSEDAIARQQAELERETARARRAGCEGQGFFSLFSGFSPQCAPINSQIQRLRGDLDRMLSELEQLKSGTTDRDSQRRAVIGQLAQNNCGAQYTAAARSSGPAGFFEALLGGGTVVTPGGDGAPAGTYRTVCVRTCDGYYFPISYSTVPGRFIDDERACHRQCPAAETVLYSYRNPGEQMEQAVSVSSQQPYTALPNAFRYRKELVAACSCRAPGQAWADALRNADDNTTLESGDIIVTDKNAKALAQPASSGKQSPKATTAVAPNATARPVAPEPVAASGPDADVNRKVRTVGPPFVAGQ